MQIKHIVTGYSKDFIKDIIESIHNDNNLLIENLTLKISIDAEEKYIQLKNPALLINHDLVIFSNSKKVSKIELETMLKNVNYGTINFAKSEMPQDESDLVIVFDQLTLSHYMKMGINETRTYYCKYFPERKIIIEAGNFSSDMEEFNSLFHINYCGYLQMNKRKIILDNELNLRQILSSCSENHVDLGIYGYIGNEAEVQQKRLTNRYN